MYQDTIGRSDHKYSHVIVQNRSEKGSPSVKDSPGVIGKVMESNCVSAFGTTDFVSHALSMSPTLK